MNNIEPYTTFTSIYNLSMCDLYSGTDNDPIVDAMLYARDSLALDNNIINFVFAVETSIFAQEINREKELLEDIPKVHRRHNQKIEVKVIVFRNIEDYTNYELNNKITIYGK